jgi:hypothetical protein
VLFNWDFPVEHEINNNNNNNNNNKQVMGLFRNSGTPLYVYALFALRAFEFLITILLHLTQLT